MKGVVIAVVIAGLAWAVLGSKSDMDILMEGNMPFVETEYSGFKTINPKEDLSIDVRDLAEQGHITIVELHDPECRGCQIMKNNIDKLNKIRPDVAIKLIQVDKRYSGYWGEKYGLNVPHIPFTVLLDKEGEIIASDDGEDNDGQELLYEWINAELRRR